MKKQTIFAIFLSLALAAGIGILLPAPRASAINGAFIQRAENRASSEAAKQTTELANIIRRADTMITNRIAVLQNLLTRVQNDTRLSSDEKTNFANDINTAVSSLTALKAKIDADTDATTARTDAKSIVTSYKIYVYFEPKVRLLLIIDNLQTASTNISNLSSKVQTLLTQLKSQGKDTTAAQTALNDITVQLATINTTLATDKTLVSNVTLATTNPQSIFVQVRKDLASVRSDFAKIRADFASMREDIRIILPQGTVTTKPGESTESAK